MSGRNRGVSSHACNRNGWWIAAVRRPGALLAIVALCGGLFATPAAAQWAASDLFPNPPVPTKAGPHGLESLAGVLDTAPVARGLGRLRLQLPGGGTVEMARDGFERRKDGDVTWRGGVTGEEGSRVILTVRNGYMAGRIMRGLDEYEIRPGPGRSHVIERVDGSIEPMQEELSDPPVGYSTYTWDPSYSPDISRLPYPNSPDNIQLLAVYTAEARAAAGGTPQIEVRIQSMVDLVNAAFIDSGMIARISLIRTEEVAYAEAGHVGMDLSWLDGNSGDFTVPAKRHFFGADLVSMIVHNGGQCAGAANVMHIPDHGFAPWAYSVSALSCGAGTLAHEIGHNMGFEHNPEDSARAEPQPDPYNPYAPIIDASYPWSFGHYVDGSFRTIMSYPTRCLSGCPMALQFSNPDISFLGSPTGILDQRDNAQTGDLTAPIVANFLDAVTGAVVNRRVAASVEDVEEMADGSVVLDSTTLELGDGLGGVQAVGLRFQNLNIPVGMRIDAAYLEFEAVDLGSDATSVQIRAEAADNGAPFSATPFDVTGRPATLASAQWDIPAWTAATEKHYSSDISAVIQEVVDRPGWLENNSMVITIGGTGIRTALSHDGGAASAPLLHVAYSRPDLPESIEMPVATFSYSCAGLTCTFTDESTSSNGAIGSWSWYFNAYLSSYSSYSVEQNPTVTFPSAGTYYIALDVADDQGPGRTDQILVLTETSANIAPVATDNGYFTDTDSVLTGNVLTDGVPDSDLDGDALTVTDSTPPMYGATVTVSADGSFTYTPSGREDDYFIYTVSDGRGGMATGYVTIKVTSKIVADFKLSCIELVCSFLDASTSDFGQIGSWSWGYGDAGVEQGQPGYTLGSSEEQNPTISFPAPGAYRVTLATSDSSGNFDFETKEVFVTYVNEAPAAALSYSCTGLTCTFTDQSTDSDGTISLWSWSFSNGTYSYEQNPTVTFPADGSYSVSLDVYDDKDGIDNVQIWVDVHGVNTAPVATANTYITYQDVAVGGNVLTEGMPDSDADGDPLTVTANSNPVNGTVTLSANGDFTYTPAAGFTGTDSFDYTIGDNNGGSATATVTVTVNAITGPVALDNAYAIDEDTAISGNVLTDGTPDLSLPGSTLTVATNTNPSNGTLTMAPDGAFAYTPNANFNGTDSFGYTISDGTSSATATVTITVNAVNDVPVATDNAYTTTEDTPITGNFMTDGVPDADIDGDTLTVAQFRFQESGILSYQPSTGQFTYSPKANFNGTDDFLYTVTDGNGISNVATVTITVTPVNDVPVAAFGHGCTGLDCAFTDGSTDIEGAIAAWSWSFGDGGVSTVQNPAHSYSAGGTYTVTLMVTDNQGATDTVTRSVTVASAANTAPVATANTYATAEDVAVGGNVLTDGTPDSDADGDALTVTSNTSPSNGAVTVAASGAFTYTPNADFNGSDSFTYTISDGNGADATATVTITVNAVNDLPVAAFSHGCTDLNCAFTDASTDIDGIIASWAWSFGDGAVSTAQSPTHGYAADGTYTVSLTATDNQGATDTVTQSVTVAGGPVAVGDIVMAPASYDFGAVLVGTTKTASLAIQNLGDAVLTVSGLTLTGGNPDFVLNGPAVPFDIQPGYQASVGVDYTPSAAGADSAALSVASNDPDTPTVAVPLSGSGLSGVPDVNLASTTLAFGDVAVGSTQRGYVDIQNVGSADLNIASMALSGSGDFAINSRYVAPFTIKPGRQVRIKVEYTPGAAGPAAATLNVGSDDPDEPSVSASLSGNGIAPPVGNPDINLPSMTLVLGDVTVGATQRGYVDIQNVGDADLTIGSLAVTGSGDFVLGNPPAVPFVIRSGRQIRLKVEYVPSIDGPAAASLNVGSDDPDEPSVAASLSGNGTAGVQDINLPAVTLAFGDVETGTPQTGTLFIQNVGTADLTVSGLSLTGGNTDFVLDTAAPFIVAAGYQATVAVTYSPSATGADAETLQIVSDDPDETPITVAVNGNGTTPPVGTPDVNLPATSIAYGDVLVGKMKTASVAIQNLGTADLNVTGLTLSGSTDFALAAGAPTSFVVTPGRQITVKVNYSPSAVGPVSGSLAIASDDPVDPSLSVNLNGNGLAGVADINVPVLSHDYGDVVVGASGSTYIAIQNLGTGDLQVTGLALTGGGDFTLAAGTPTTFVIAAGRQVTVRVDYMPSTTGIVGGTLTITSADLDEPSVSVTLSGNGTPAV